MPLATGGTVSTVSTAIAIAFMCLIGAPARSQPAPADAAQAGFTALDHGDADTASTVFRRALSQHPRDPVLLYGAGIAAHLLGRERDALQLLQQALQIRGGVRLAVNYGLNRVRFPSPVRAESKIRGRFTLQSLKDVSDAREAVFSVVMEDQGQGKPCCVAEWVVRYYP